MYSPYSNILLFFLRTLLASILYFSNNSVSKYSPITSIPPIITYLSNYQYNDSNFYYFTTKTNKKYTEYRYKKGDFFVFGPETRGIPEEILNQNKETCATIPMKKETRSLNLSNSVAIAAYEAIRQLNINL